MLQSGRTEHPSTDYFEVQPTPIEKNTHHTNVNEICKIFENKVNLSSTEESAPSKLSPHKIGSRPLSPSFLYNTHSVPTKCRASEDKNHVSFPLNEDFVNKVDQVEKDKKKRINNEKSTTKNQRQFPLDFSQLHANRRSRLFISKDNDDIFTPRNGPSTPSPKHKLSPIKESSPKNIFSRNKSLDDSDSPRTVKESLKKSGSSRDFSPRSMLNKAESGIFPEGSILKSYSCPSNLSPRFSRLNSDEDKNSSELSDNFFSRPLKKMMGSHSKINIYSRIKKILKKGAESRGTHLIKASEQNQIIKEMFLRELEKNKLENTNLGKITSIEQQKKEMQRIPHLLKWIQSNSFLVDPVIENIKNSNEILLHKLKNDECNYPLASTIFSIFNKFIIFQELKKTNQEGVLEGFMNIYEQVKKSQNIKKVFLYSIGSPNYHEAKKYIKLISHWSDYSSLNVLKDLNLLNFQEILKVSICDKKYEWEKKIDGDEISKISLKDIVRSYLSEDTGECIYEKISVNGKAVDIRPPIPKEELKLKIFENILTALKDHAFPINFEIPISEQAKRLVSWNNPEQLEKYLPWEPLTCEFLLKMTTINFRLILREFMEKKFPTLFTGSMRMYSGQGVECQFNIEVPDPSKIFECSASQIIRWTIYPMEKSGGSSTRFLKRDRPLANFVTSWTGYMSLAHCFSTKEDKKEKATFQFLNYEFTEYASENDKYEILQALSYLVITEVYT